MPQGKELPVAGGGYTVATGSSSFRFFSPSVEPGVEEGMLTPPRASPSVERERDWWSANLEGEMEKLAVPGSLSLAASGSKHPDGKADHWSTQTEGARLAVNERQEMEVDEVVPEIQPSSNETEGDFIMCGSRRKSSDSRVRRNASLCSGKTSLLRPHSGRCKIRTFLCILSCIFLCSKSTHCARCTSIFLLLSSFQFCLSLSAASTFVKFPPSICVL